MPDASLPTSVSDREALERLGVDARRVADRPELETWVRQRAASIAFEVALTLAALDALEAIPAAIGGQSVKVAELPPCDLCGDGTPAQYDSRTVHGPWGYLCAAHWRSEGPGRLGTGYGQRLVVEPEPATWQDAEAGDTIGRPS